jgi:hypothetical protein
MEEDPADVRRIGDEGNQLAPPAAVRAVQDVDPEHAAH